MEDFHDKIVSFHIGRGGRFNNPGHITYEPYVERLRDLYNDMTIIEEDEEGNRLPVEQHVMYDSGGKEILRGLDIYEETGTLDIDGEYDTYIVVRLDEMPEKYENALMNAVKDGRHMSPADRVLFTEYLAEQGYDKAEILLDDKTWYVYDSLSEFVDEDEPIDPYSFCIYDQESNQEARLVKFKFVGVESSCIIYPDGTVFTLKDWKSGDYPTRLEEVDKYEWVDRFRKDAIMLNGLPRIMLQF